MKSINFLQKMMFSAFFAAGKAQTPNKEKQRISFFFPAYFSGYNSTDYRNYHSRKNQITENGSLSIFGSITFTDKNHVFTGN